MKIGKENKILELKLNYETIGLASPIWTKPYQTGFNLLKVDQGGGAPPCLECRP